jgi:hypothetical protein
MGLEFDLSSFDRDTERLIRKINQEVAIPALEKTSAKIIIDAKKETPVDTGKLKGSLNYEVKRSGTPTAILGSSVDYSFIVHEDLDAFHPVGNAKFLQNAVIKNAGTLEKNVRARMRRI